MGTPEKRALVFAGDQEHARGTPEKCTLISTGGSRAR